MVQDDKKSAENSGESGPKAQNDHAAGHGEKISGIEKKLADELTGLQAKARTAGAETADFVRRHGRCAEMGAGLAESVAGESLGEIVGGSLGSLLGPEGTVIGAEVGSFAGEVLGSRRGEAMAKKLLHREGGEAPLKEDIRKEGSARLSGHAGEAAGSLIGDLLLDEAGAEAGAVVGEKIGKLAGALAYERMEKLHGKHGQEPASEENSRADKDSTEEGA